MKIRLAIVPPAINHELRSMVPAGSPDGKLFCIILGKDSNPAFAPNVDGTAEATTKKSPAGLSSPPSVASTPSEK